MSHLPIPLSHLLCRVHLLDNWTYLVRPVVSTGRDHPAARSNDSPQSYHAHFRPEPRMGDFPENYAL